MAKYILVKKVKGKKYEYQVIDADSKAIVSKRTSARDYVACTADGSFYFGRLDLCGRLVGKNIIGQSVFVLMKLIG